jgi:hypothetical protein
MILIRRDILRLSRTRNGIFTAAVFHEHRLVTAVERLKCTAMGGQCDGDVLDSDRLCSERDSSEHEAGHKESTQAAPSCLTAALQAPRVPMKVGRMILNLDAPGIRGHLGELLGRRMVPIGIVVRLFASLPMHPKCGSRKPGELGNRRRV